MSEEKSPKGQVETALERAAKYREKSPYGRNRELLELTGGLKRVTLHLTAQEYERLLTRSGAGTIQSLLEAFVADVTDSERSIWEECRHEARQWRNAHRKAEYVASVHFDKLDRIDTEGGEEC